MRNEGLVVRLVTILDADTPDGHLPMDSDAHAPLVVSALRSLYNLALFRTLLPRPLSSLCADPSMMPPFSALDFPPQLVMGERRSRRPQDCSCADGLQSRTLAAP